MVHFRIITYWNISLTDVKLSTNIKNVQNFGRMLLDLNLFDQAMKSRCLCQTIHQYCQPTHLTQRIRLIFDSDIKMIWKTKRYLETFSAQCDTFWGSHDCFLYHNISCHNCITKSLMVIVIHALLGSKINWIELMCSSFAVSKKFVKLLKH